MLSDVGLDVVINELLSLDLRGELMKCTVILSGIKKRREILKL